MIRRSLFALVLTLISLAAFAQSEPPPSKALLEDATSYAAQTGVSVDEAVRRLRLQNEIGDLDAALAEAEPSTYAGLWIDDDSGYRVVVRFTDAAAEGRLRARVAGGKLQDLVEMRRAKWSLEELRKRRRDVRGHAGRAKVPTNSDINVFENRAEIYVLDDKLNAAMTRAGAHIPEGVVLRRVGKLAEKAALHGGAIINGCTSGFNVQAASGELGISTAAHCDNVQYAQGVSLPFRAQKESGSYDVQWNSACDLLQVTNQFETGIGLRALNAVRSRSAQAINSYICKYGRTTGRTCGWIQSKDYDPDAWYDLNPFDGTFIRVDGHGVNLVDPGDSGGPWYSEDAGLGITFGYTYGTLLGMVLNDKDAIYMAVNYMSGIGVTPLLGTQGPTCNLIPVPNFTGGGRLDGTATFNASTSYDPDGYLVGYEWNFGDGTTGASSSPYINHVYPPTRTVYWVTLTVIDNEGRRALLSKEACVPQTMCVDPLP